MSPAFIFSTRLQIWITSLLSELRMITFLRRPKLTYSTKAKGTSFPSSASRRRTRAAVSVLHQLDQKIIYPHYDFKHLTEKYFEIGMKLNDFSIQLVKYWVYRRSEAHTPWSGQFPGFKIEGTCAPSKQTSLEGTPFRFSFSEERNGYVLIGVSAASIGSFPYSSTVLRRLVAISGILALARASASSKISLPAPASSLGNRSGRSIHIWARVTSSSLHRLSAFNEHYFIISG